MSVIDGWGMNPRTPEEIEEEAARYGPLTEAVRTLMDATLMSEAGADDVARARALIDEAAALLDRSRAPEPIGTRWSTDGSRHAWGNAVVGLRNPIAPPLTINYGAAGEPCWAEAELGPLYEGPPGLVHGGAVAMMLDQILGAAAFHAGAPGMTGTLTVRYRQGTKLGPVRVEATFDRAEGVKSFVTGRVSTPDGLCAEAEGVFILPREVRHRAAELTRAYARRMLTDKNGTAVTVDHNPDQLRYEIHTEGSLAGFTEYRDRTVDGAAERIFFHTEVAEEFGGRGLATVLVREALDATRAAGLTIVGVCPLVAAFLKKNPEYAEASRSVTPEVLEWLRSTRG